MKNDLSLKHINLFSRYASLRLIGEQKAAAFDKGKQKDYYVLQGVSSIGNLEKLYFDIETGFLECTEIERVVTASPDLQRTFFSDYRDVQGVKLPFKSRLEAKQFNATMEIISYELNSPVADSMFSLSS